MRGVTCSEEKKEGEAPAEGEEKIASAEEPAEEPVKEENENVRTPFAARYTHRSPPACQVCSSRCPAAGVLRGASGVRRAPDPRRDVHPRDTRLHGCGDAAWARRCRSNPTNARLSGRTHGCMQEMTLEEYQKAEADKRAAFKAQFAKGVANRDADASLASLKVQERLTTEQREAEVFFQGKTESDAKKRATEKAVKKVRLHVLLVVCARASENRGACG